MQAQPLIRPGIARGLYPEQEVTDHDWLEQCLATSGRRLRDFTRPKNRQLQKFVHQVNRWEKALKKLDEKTLTRHIDDIKRRLILDFDNQTINAKAFAIIKEVSDRTMGIRHYDVQVMGGWIMLNGMLAEMQTGEGKTLTATLPACTAALAGIPVHVISVNDYLVSRDADEMRPLYSALGLSVGTITQSMDSAQRQAAYQCDICYCTANQLVFDYLKDRLVINQKNQNIDHIHLERLHSPDSQSKQLLLRGLCFAIIDEADSVLIDEARTPLILSREGKNCTEEIIFQQALLLARQLQIGQDYRVNPQHRKVEITKTGAANLSQMVKGLSKFWRGKRRRLELVTQALSAEKLFLKDQDYLVSDGKVIIIDEHTGRAMPDRKWEQGLHQMIETKENCQPTAQNETLARISNQRFFRRYLRLSGMTGTAQEVTGELWTDYGLNIVTVPTHKPAQRIIKPVIVFNDNPSKWDAVLTSVRDAYQERRPILLATRSVATSELLSKKLTQAKFHHRVLNAQQDQEEADIIAQAGKPGQITVATNMAGRGTDIKLATGVANLGGLHVITCELNASRRVDRQVMGRCGRQGDPGIVEQFYSLQDEVIHNFLGKNPIGFALIAANRLPLGPLSILLNKSIIYLSQLSIEQQHRKSRKALQKSEKRIGTLLAFSGSLE